MVLSTVGTTLEIAVESQPSATVSALWSAILSATGSGPPPRLHVEIAIAISLANINGIRHASGL
jgi:hypothetical protein